MVTPEAESPTEQGLPTRLPVGRLGKTIDRLRLWLVAVASHWIIRILGSTWRWEVEGVEYLDDCTRDRGAIPAFWHGRLLASAYFFRRRGIVVMTSRHRDGEYISAIIRRFGFSVARGSSTRGARGAMVEMIRGLRRNAVVAMTVDGPRGPRYVAKEGAVWLAAKTGRPLIPFNVSAQRKWVLRSWDLFEIPRPFSRMLVRMTSPFWVGKDASEGEMQEAQRRLQSTLDDLRERGDCFWDNQAAP